MLTWERLVSEFLTISTDLETAVEDLYEAGHAWAEAENDHRKARARAYVHATGKNREERESKADPFFEAERLAAFYAEARKEACLERVRSLRTRMSALQTIIAARRAEQESTAYNQVGHNQA